MKKLLGLMFVLVLVTALAGCSGGGSVDDLNGDTNGDEDAQPVSEKWSAYVFDQVIKPATGGTGALQSFVMEQSLTEDGQTRTFSIEGTYLGKATEQIKTNKLDTAAGYDTIVVTTPVECYKVKHRVTQIEGEPDEDMPDWFETTVYIPTGGVDSSTAFLWLFAMSSSEDSEGSSGMWSYYLTSEMQNDGSFYLPYTEGDYEVYDSWVTYGLYGYAWPWMQSFAEGGDKSLTEGSWSYGGYSYSIEEKSKTLGSYEFDIWALDITMGAEAHYKTEVSASLPLPVLLDFGADGDRYVYELKSVTLG